MADWNFTMVNGHTFKVTSTDGYAAEYDRNYVFKITGGSPSDPLADVVERDTGAAIIVGLPLSWTFVNGSPVQSFNEAEFITYIPRHFPVNFLIENEKAFFIDRFGGARPIGAYPRKFKIKFRKNGSIAIVHVDTEIIILDGLTEDVIFIHGEPLKSWELLRMVIYNFMCACSGEGSVPPELAGIFDVTFDETFE